MRERGRCMSRDGDDKQRTGNKPRTFGCLRPRLRPLCGTVLMAERTMLRGALMKLRYPIALLIILAAPALAHDFWIQPSRFQAVKGVPLPVTFQIGHGSARDRWGNNDRIVMVADFFGGRREDRRKDLRSDRSADLLTVFDEQGLHVLGLQSTYAYSELPGIRFNDYLATEGLRTIIADRKRSGRSDAGGRERYSRRAKAYVQVGAGNEVGRGLPTRAIGMKLEIVPERNPYAMDRSRTLPVHVLFKGQRLAGATIKLTNLRADEKPVAVKVTDSKGAASFTIPRNGDWLLNVVWGEPLEGDPKADYDTVFSSLTFGDPDVIQR
jgi:uncharacterized GH25 family protein